jgi:crossover junction endodeoxyribonuclease RuvC
MFDGLVLGVDPGLASTGVAAVRGSNGRPRIEWAATIRTPAGAPEASRLRCIHDAVQGAIEAWSPVSVAIERLAWGRNVVSAMAVARASGVVLLAADQAGLPVAEYPPSKVKLGITGSGSAGKDQVRRALERLLGVEDVPAEPDAADAVAIAVCHLHQSRLRTLVARA